jgi:hypothetical protein
MPGGQFGENVTSWLSFMEAPGESASTAVFSSFESADWAEPEYIEPLSFILRHPRSPCSTDIYDKSWIILASNTDSTPTERKFSRYSGNGGTQRFFFDAGADTLAGSTRWFVDKYEKRGIHFDGMFAWEPRKINWTEFNRTVPAELRERLTLYNRPASSDPLSLEDNPVAKLVKLCRAEDFCVLKIDVDTPPLETLWIQQILQCTEISSRIDEFFFEHHVHGILNVPGVWGGEVFGQFADTYHLLSEMRLRGIRAHSWI